MYVYICGVSETWLRIAAPIGRPVIITDNIAAETENYIVSIIKEIAMAVSQASVILVIIPRIQV